MAINIITPSGAALTALFIFLLHLGGGGNAQGPNFEDSDYVELALNLEYLETEFFLFGALGYGLDRVNRSLTKGGPPSQGGQKAHLTPETNAIITEFGYQEVGHLRAIESMVAGFARPLINISKECFGDIMENVVGHALIPPFDPYANDINYLLASYLIPYVGLTGYVGAASNLQDPAFKKLVAGLLGVESGQDAVIRTLLYQKQNWAVFPYQKKSNRRYPPQFYTVADFTNMISEFRDKLGGEGLKDEGIWVDQRLGAEGKVNGNVLAGDEYSMSYERSPNEILRIVYGNKDGVPGGFFPNGAGGKFARAYHN